MPMPPCCPARPDDDGGVPVMSGDLLIRGARVIDEQARLGSWGMCRSAADTSPRSARRFRQMMQCSSMPRAISRARLHRRTLRLAVMAYDCRPHRSRDGHGAGDACPTAGADGVAGLSLGLVYPPSAYTDEENCSRSPKP